MNTLCLRAVSSILIFFIVFTTTTQSLASEDDQARLQVDFALDVLQVKKITILHDKSDYGKQLAERANTFLENDSRAEVVLYEGITPGAVDYTAVIRMILRIRSEAVIFNGYYPEAAKIVTQMRYNSRGMDTIFIASDGVKDDNFIELAGDYAEGAYITGPSGGGSYAVYQVQDGVFVALNDNGWKTIRGTVTYNGSPVCAMALANGQYMFTCKAGDDFGTYELNVPPDSNGEITLQAFVSGLAPFRMTTDASNLDVDVAMQAAIPDSQSPVVSTVTASDASTPSGWARITGTVSADDAPLCAMVLANGQYMFSCGVNDGVYDLTAPLDGNGQITLYVFVSGKQPYKRTFTP